MSSRPMSTTRAQALLAQRAKLLTDVSAALNGGPPINWTAGERFAYTAQLRGLGFDLVTKGQARARGLDILPGTTPVGRGEFGPPLSQVLDLYLLEIDRTEQVEEPPPEAMEPPLAPVQPKPIRQKRGRRPPRNPAVPEAKSEATPKPAKLQWLTTTEAATYLGETPEAMQMMRYEHAGPSYQRNGSNVMYRSTDLDEWLATQA